MSLDVKSPPDMVVVAVPAESVAWKPSSLSSTTVIAFPESPSSWMALKLTYASIFFVVPDGI